MAKQEAEAEWTQAVTKKAESGRRSGAVGAVGAVGLWGVWGAGCLILGRGLDGCRHDVAGGEVST